MPIGPTYKDFTPVQFTDFLRQFPVEQRDPTTGIVWLKEDSGLHQCADGVDFRNHEAGGPDGVRVVIAERGEDAVSALEAYRKSRDEPVKS